MENNVKQQRAPSLICATVTADSWYKTGVKLKNLVISDLNRNEVIEGQGKLGENNVTQSQANSTGVQPEQKVKNKLRNLSCYIYC